MTLAETIADFIQIQTDESGEWNPPDLPNSPFDIYYFRARKITFHFISLAVFNSLSTAHGQAAIHQSTYFFQTLSEAFAEQNIKLIHIWEDVWHQQMEIIKSRLLALLGNSVRIHGRLTQVRRIDKSVLDDFLIANHLQASVACRYKYGLFLKKQLVAVASFAGPRKMLRNGEPYRSYELLRFANLRGHTVVGGLDKLLKAFIREHNPDDLMTYADRDWSDGHSYEQLGFQRIELTPPRYFWLNIHTFQRHYPHRLVQDFPEIKQIPDEEKDNYLIEKGFCCIANAGNIKFLKDFRTNS